MSVFKILILLCLGLELFLGLGFLFLNLQETPESLERAKDYQLGFICCAVAAIFFGFCLDAARRRG